MAKKMEQFIDELEAAPKGEFGNAKVPKALRPRVSREIRTVMKEASPDAQNDAREEAALRERRAGLLDEIKELEEQEGVVGKKIFADISLPAIEARRREVEEIEIRLTEEPPEPTVEEKAAKAAEEKTAKKEKVKELLKQAAESERLDSEKLLSVLEYVDDWQARKLAQLAAETLGGEEKIKERFAVSYLAKEILPDPIAKELASAEARIKDDKKRKISKIKDAAVRDRLEKAIETTPVTSEELTTAISTKNILEMHGVSAPIVEMALNDGALSASDAETALVLGKLGGQTRYPEPFNRLMDWTVKERPRLLLLREKGKNATKKEKEELARLEKSAKEARDMSYYNVDISVVDEEKNRLRDLETTTLPLARLERAVEETTAAAVWKEKFATDYEAAFNERFATAHANAERTVGDYKKERRRLDELNAEAGEIRVALNDKTDLGDPELQPIAERLVALQAEIKKRNAALVDIGRSLSGRHEDIFTGAQHDAARKREEDLRSLRAELEKLRVSGKGSSYDVKRRKDGLVERVDESAKYQREAVERLIRSGAFDERVKQRELSDRVSRDLGSARAVQERISSEIGGDRESTDRANAASKLLGELAGKIREEAEADERQERDVVRKFEDADRALAELRKKRAALEGKWFRGGSREEADKLIGAQETTLEDLGRQKTEIQKRLRAVRKLYATVIAKK